MEADETIGKQRKDFSERAELFMNRAFKLLVIVLVVVGAVALLVFVGMWAMHVTMMGR